MKHLPYVSVSGIGNLADLLSIQPSASSLISVAPRRLVGAVLVTSATLRGQPKNRNPGRYADVGHAPALLRVAKTLGITPAIHLCSTPAMLASDLQLLRFFGGDAAEIIQVNVPEASAEDLRMLRAMWPAAEIVLQVEPVRALEASRHLDQALPWVDHVLLDGSRGEGEPLSCDAISRCVSAPWLLEGAGVVIAGGIGRKPHGSLSEIRSRVTGSVWPTLSFDAESGLRSTVDAHGYDRIDSDKVRSLLQAVVDVDRWTP